MSVFGDIKEKQVLSIVIELRIGDAEKKKISKGVKLSKENSAGRVVVGVSMWGESILKTHRCSSLCVRKIVCVCE